MALQPLLPRKITNNLFDAIGDQPVAPNLGGLDALLMPPPLPAPAATAINVAPPMSVSTSDPLTLRKMQLEDDLDRRSNPVKPTTALGKIGHVAGNIGNVLGDIFAPDVMANIPGTQLYNERILERDKMDLAKVSQEETARANRAKTEADTEYSEQRPDIERAKVLQHLTTSLAPKGFKVKENPASPGGFDLEQDPDSPYTRKLNALASLQDAQAEHTALMTENAQNRYQPGTPQYEEWHKRQEQADKKLQATLEGLGLRAESLRLRQNDQNANFYGVGPNGQTLPNAPQFEDDDGNITTGGLKGAKTAVTQQAAVGTFKDLGGSIARTRNLVNELHKSGGSLSDPRVVEALSDAGDHQGVISTVLRSKLSKEGMSEAQVNAVAAVASLREQLGTLRAASKGTGSEGQTQRMLTAAPTGGDTPELADRKFAELQATYERLAPSITSIGGGMSLNGKGGHKGSSAPQPSGGTQKFTVDGRTYNIPADQVNEFKKEFPNAK